MNTRLNIYHDSDKQRYVSEENKHSDRSEFERDRARVLHSSALRRLGGKTQVLRAGQADFTRDRLTHSLEVAQVGRHLADSLGCDPDVVDAACLSHDLGHPPFGHNGEHALDEVCRDIGGFEGNAQTLRILTRIEPKIMRPDGTGAGVNLTRATIDATVKYPWSQLERPVDKQGTLTKKFGVYQDDLEVFHWMREGNKSNARCLEAQIMDISDDIAYSVHDMEDAVQRGSLQPEIIRSEAVKERTLRALKQWYNPDLLQTDMEEAYDRIVKLPLWPQNFCGLRSEIAQLKNLTSEIIGRFCSSIDSATRLANNGHDGALSRYDADLVIPDTTLAEIYVIKGMAVEFVMEPREHEPAYLQERTVIFDICEALLEDRGRRLAPEFQEDYRRASSDSQRLRVVVDQVASITDISANRLHASICGMISRP